MRRLVSSDHDTKPTDDELTECERKVEALEEENAQLRNAAETFGDLAERLNAERRADAELQRTDRPAKREQSRPGKDLPN